MKVTIAFLPENNLVLERYSGEMTIKGLKEITPKIWSLTEYHEKINAWIDLRGIDLNMNTNDISELTAFLQDSEESSKGKLALILRDPGDLAFAHTFEQHMIFRRSTGVFTTQEDGLRFLEVPIEAVNALESMDAITLELQ